MAGWEDDLSRMLDRDNQVRNEEHERRSAQEQAAKSAAEVWKQRVESTLIPGLKPVLEILRTAGWQASATLTQQGFNVSVYRGEMSVYQSRSRPNLSFEIQKGWTGIRVVESTPSSVGDYPHSLEATVDSDSVNKIVTEFVSKLVKK
ncbi:hypothetical protein LOC51_32080 [Rubrivivax sp. JA1024]|nr:hypothetical protein [Rubrivivax sp. JA1024]